MLGRHAGEGVKMVRAVVLGRMDCSGAASAGQRISVVFFMHIVCVGGCVCGLSWSAAGMPLERIGVLMARGGQGCMFVA
jgi:hypothetical protein